MAGVSSKEPVDLGGGRSYDHPDMVKRWLDDMREWPAVRAPDIIFYLLNSKACDLQAVKNYRSLESYNYLQSGWVGKLLVHRIDQELSYVRGEVSPSQAVSGTPRTAWICAKMCGEVMTAGCTCMAGKGKVCSHVGAILWKIDMAVCQGLTTKTCTDQTAAWNAGTKRNVHPAALEDIDFHMQQGVVDTQPARHSRPMFIVPQTKLEIQKQHEESQFPDLFTIPGTLLYETLNAPPRPHRHTADDVVKIVHGDHSVDNAPNGCALCSAFYCKYVALSTGAAAALSAETANQSSQLWLFARRVRLSASNVAKVPKKETTSGERAATRMLSPVFFGNAATKHGKRMEAVARVQFSKKTGLSVTKVGSVVSEEMPWLSASPDGMIDGENAILEIKCPFVNDISQLIEHGKYDVKKRQDGTFILLENGPNGYYSQHLRGHVFTPRTLVVTSSPSSCLARQSLEVFISLADKYR
ncbi:hypothetical protein HPB49_010296 [Dermacentor silvarum]|uniref:Uncharacterized protein n=1 Tax=Dermacentor silvarum TaxID=543639 RepID=A0ACB8CKE9_DERSI|nr:hypothetical protein HPB49_010296 [Dermacentor silvarum]